MQVRANQDVPEWALRRVAELTIEEYGLPRADNKFSGLRDRAFARYIAQHEEAPVDPLLIEAREIVIGWYDNTFGTPANMSLTEKYRNGSNDQRAEVQQALAALRRGIEIAKVQPS